MTTYLIEKEMSIKRQEGNDASIIFIVPDILSLINRTARYVVVDNKGNAIITKDISSGLSISDQQISVILNASDTLGYSGKHRWELELMTPDIITIGRGTLEIIPKLLR